MVLPVLTCRKLVSLLDEFYAGRPAAQALDVAVVRPDDLPLAQRRLLVHDQDMTSTLARFYAEPIELEVLDRRQAGEQYRRHIVLKTAQTHRAVEYGASRVSLPLLDESTRREVLAARVPLGQVLNNHHTVYRACPGAFFKVTSNGVINVALGLEGEQTLYGRCGCLADRHGRSIAEVVEILPPEAVVVGPVADPPRSAAQSGQVGSPPHIGDSIVTPEEKP